VMEKDSGITLDVGHMKIIANLVKNIWHSKTF
jgi:hypothetical protein